jgi:hypothetical protein
MMEAPYAPVRCHPPYVKKNQPVLYRGENAEKVGRKQKTKIWKLSLKLFPAQICLQNINGMDWLKQGFHKEERACQYHS